MMNREINIKITGTQVDEYGEENVIELVTAAKYYEKKNASYIVYEESEICGIENSTTRLKIQSEKVEMKRFGENSSDMVFDESESHALSYKTPFGVFKMRVDTERVEVMMKESLKGSTIDVEYELSLNDGNAVTKNRLSIEIV